MSLSLYFSPKSLNMTQFLFWTSQQTRRAFRCQLIQEESTRVSLMKLENVWTHSANTFFHLQTYVTKNHFSFSGGTSRIDWFEALRHLMMHESWKGVQQQPGVPIANHFRRWEFGGVSSSSSLVFVSFVHPGAQRRGQPVNKSHVSIRNHYSRRGTKHSNQGFGWLVGTLVPLPGVVVARLGMLIVHTAMMEWEVILRSWLWVIDECLAICNSWE